MLNLRKNHSNKFCEYALMSNKKLGHLQFLTRLQLLLARAIFARDKHPSLNILRMSDEEKGLITLSPGLDNRRKQT